MAAVLEVNRVHFPVTTLGWGRRIGIWVQGCTIRCPGCISRDTWERRPERALAVEAIVKGVKGWLPEADGITVSGGEPLEQAAGVAALVDALRREGFSGDVLIFTGLEWDEACRRHGAVVDRADAMVTGPYLAGAGQARYLRGSDNQEFVVLTALGRERYGRDANGRAWEPGARRLDVLVDGETLWAAGIPRAGEWAALQSELQRRGWKCQASHEPGWNVRA